MAWSCGRAHISNLRRVLSPISRAERETSPVVLGMNEICESRSNIYGLVILTCCSKYTKKKIEATRLFSIHTYSEAAALSLQL